MEATMKSHAGIARAPKKGGRLTLSQIPLPTTTRANEVFNCVSHALGVALGIFALGWMFSAARFSLTPNVAAGILMYGLSLVALYAVSATYHGLPQGFAKKVMRVCDHCTIYLLIAGCYTPVALIAFWGHPYAAALLVLEWGIAAVGIALNIWNMSAKPVKAFSMVSYLVMGWAILMVPLSTLLEVGGTWLPWVAAGGVAYTVGIVFFKLGTAHPKMHCVWHLFVLAGSLAQMVGFIQLV